MTAPIPMNTPQIGTPQLVGNPLEEKFLQFLLQGAQFSQQAQGLQLERERLKLAKQKQTADAEADAQRQLVQGQVGEILRQLLAPQAAAPAQAPGAAPQAGPPTVGLETPSMPAPMAPPQGQAIPDVAGVFARAPAAAIPQAVQLSQDLRARAEKSADEARRDAAIAESLDAIPDPAKRSATQSLIRFAQAGLNLAPQIQQQIFPALTNNGLDPATVNATTSLFRTGQFTWGQARQVTGLPGVPGVPDDAKMPPAVSLRANQQAQRASAVLTTMRSSAVLIDNFTQQTEGLNFMGSVLKSIRQGGVFEGIVNKLTDENTQRAVNAMRNFAQGWRLFISGQAATDKEYADILAASTEQFGDSESTRSQKRVMRQMMLNAVEQAAAGTGLMGSVVLSQLADLAKSNDWSPELRNFIESERRKALGAELDRRAPLIPNGMPPETPDDLEETLNRIGNLIDGVRP